MSETTGDNMGNTTDGATRKQRTNAWEWAVLAAIVLAAAAIRAWLLWRTPLVPGRNGGYYLVQARALLEHGHLGIPDLPLAFLVQAGVAKLVQILSGQPLETCIFFAVRLCDALLPPLAAVPVFLIGRAWCRRTGHNVWPALASAAMAVCGVSALSMVGDFEKNSLGLVWLAGLIAALHAWMSSRTRGRAVTVLVFLGLCGLTHIGVFGVALLLTVLTWTADLIGARGPGGMKTLYRIGAVALAGLAVAGLCSGLVLWKFDAARIERLSSALRNPLLFLETGGHFGRPEAGLRGGGPPDRQAGRFRPPPSGDRPDSPRENRSDFARGNPPPPSSMGGRQGPRGRGPAPLGRSGIVFLVIAAGALALAFRRGVPASARAAVIGCGVTVIVLTGPWTGSDMAERLQLISAIPAACSAAFMMVSLPGRWTASACAAGVLAVTAVTSGPFLRRGDHAAVSLAEFEELQTLKAQVLTPEQTLVVARHGLEWWTAWVLHTHVAQSRAVRASDWKKYSEVLFIQEKRGHHGPPDASRHGERGGTGTDRQTASDRPRGGPPGETFGGPGGGQMMEGTIPDGAEILSDGTYFRLARVKTPPDTLSDSAVGTAVP